MIHVTEKLLLQGLCLRCIRKLEMCNKAAQK